MSGWNPASHHEHPQMNPQVRKALQFRVFPTYPSHVSYAELHRVKRVQGFPYSPLARQLCWASSREACSGFSLLTPRMSAMPSFIAWNVFRVFPTHPSHVSYAELHRVKHVQRGCANEFCTVCCLVKSHGPAGDRINFFKEQKLHSVCIL